jgi:hypothetical protein
MSNNFSRSIGHTGPITTSSVGIGQASGSAVSGYAWPANSTGPGAPPHTGESQHAALPFPNSSAAAAGGKKARS